MNKGSFAGPVQSFINEQDTHAFEERYILNQGTGGYGREGEPEDGLHAIGDEASSIVKINEEMELTDHVEDRVLAINRELEPGMMHKKGAILSLEKNHYMSESIPVDRV